MASPETLRQFGRLLADAGAHELLAAREGEGERSDLQTMDLSAVAQPLRTVLRLFVQGAAVRVEEQLPCLAPLEALGLLQRDEDRVTAGEFRLVSHLGLFLFCHRVSPAAKLYYGNDSLALSRLLAPVEGRALDLCAGVGAQALVCAQTAASVTAVDVEPLAETVFRINAEVNGLESRVKYLVGDLYEPVAGRQFDRICANPPFMPVPPGVRFPVFADGGPDGLAVVLRILRGLPTALAPGGRCQLVGAMFGSSDGPDLSSFEGSADEARLAIEVTCLWREELRCSAMLASCLGTAVEGAKELDFRAHFDALGVTHLYCYVLAATHARRPGIRYVQDDLQRAIVGI